MVTYMSESVSMLDRLHLIILQTLNIFHLQNSMIQNHKMQNTYKMDFNYKMHNTFENLLKYMTH